MKLKVIGSNQTVLSSDGTEVFFSYNTPVAAFIEGRGIVATSQKFSRTTSKHVTMWTKGRNVTVLSPEDFAKIIA